MTSAGLTAPPDPPASSTGSAGSETLPITFALAGRARSSGKPASRGDWFFGLAVTAAASTYLLIVAGAVVRVTGSGLGCPDWPTCHGSLIPPLRADALIEYAHRLLGAIVSVMIVALPVSAWLWRRERRILLPVTLIPVLLAVQIVLGAVVVWLELPPMVVLVHLGFAIAILGGLVWVAVQAAPLSRLMPAAGAGASRLRPAPGQSSASAGRFMPAARRSDRHYSRLLAATTATVFFLVLTGAYTRATGASWACAGFPGCDVPEAAVQALEASGRSGLVQIHLFHRYTAYFATVLVAASVAETWRLRRHVPAMRQAAWLLLGCLVVQLAIGAVGVSTGLPTALRGAHVAGAAAVWAAAVLLFGLSRRAVPPVAPSPARSGAGQQPDGGFPLAASGAASSSMIGTRVRAYFYLTKPKVILLLEVPTLAAMLVAGPDWPPLQLVMATLIGGALAAGGAAAINAYMDRDIDAVMGVRTQGRPIPAGIVRPGEALALGLTLAVLSFVVLVAFTNLLAAFLAQVALLIYVFVYTYWLKRSTPSNIVIGGAAGAIPPLVGWAAVTGELGPVAWLLFAVIFFWTPPHFWALSLLIRQQYARARIPMLPVVRGDRETRRQIVYYTLQMIAVTVLLFAFQFTGVFYLTAAVLLGSIFLYYALRLWREATARAAARLFHYSMLYLWLLCASLVIDKRVFA